LLQKKQETANAEKQAESSREADDGQSWFRHAGFTLRDQKHNNYRE